MTATRPTEAEVMRKVAPALGMALLRRRERLAREAAERKAA